MIRRLIILLLIVGCVFAREYIAIIDFEGIGVNENEARALTQRLTSEMIALEVYQVVERSEMKRLLEEQKFQYSGCVDMKCAIEVGKMLGAKYMVIGSVSKFGDSYSIDSRMIDVETSEAYVSGSYVAEGKIDILLTSGTKSIARQLCELEDAISVKQFSNKDEYKITSNISNSNIFIIKNNKPFHNKEYRFYTKSELVNLLEKKNEFQNDKLLLDYKNNSMKQFAHNHFKSYLGIAMLLSGLNTSYTNRGEIDFNYLWYDAGASILFWGGIGLFSFDYYLNSKKMHIHQQHCLSYLINKYNNI